MALIKSIDGGKSWSIYKITTSYGCANAGAIDQNNDNTIYAGGYTGTVSVGALFKTIDGGTSWIDMSTNISGTVHSIAIDPNLSSRLYIGTDNGIFKSEDAGLTWMQVAYFPVKGIEINPDSTNEIFAAGAQGVFFSEDGGLTWEAFQSDLFIDNLQSFCLDAVNKTLYTGVSYGSIYRTRLLEDYMLAINANTGGTTDPAPKGYMTELGTDVTLKAIPDTDFGFSHWSGDIPQGHEKDNPLSITVNSDKYITANFTQLRCTLTIESGNGGTTDPAPGKYKYDTGTQVTIRATANSGYKFKGWSGDVSGTTNPIKIAMDVNKTIKANFTSTEEPGKKAACFIATAAFGSPLHPSVRILRNFRDQYLMPNKIGRALVDFYYKHSPTAADLIAKHRVLKAAAQVMLLPLVAFSCSMLWFGPAITVIILGLNLAFAILFIPLYRKRMRKSLIKTDQRDN